MKEIKFEDIRKGDTISRNFMGLSITGIAHHISDAGGHWNTEDNGTLVSRSETIYLIDRPAPPLPKQAKPVIRATRINGYEVDWEMARNDSGDWFRAIPKPIFTYSDDEIEEWEEIK